MSVHSEASHDQIKERLIEEVQDSSMTANYLGPESVYDVYKGKSTIAGANCCSRLFFCWSSKYIKMARKIQMGIHDFGGLRKSDHVDSKSKRLQANYDE